MESNMRQFTSPRMFVLGSIGNGKSAYALAHFQEWWAPGPFRAVCSNPGGERGFEFPVTDPCSGEGAGK